MGIKRGAVVIAYAYALPILFRGFLTIGYSIKGPQNPILIKAPILAFFGCGSLHLQPWRTVSQKFYPDMTSHKFTSSSVVVVVVGVVVVVVVIVVVVVVVRVVVVVVVAAAAAAVVVVVGVVVVVVLNRNN